MNVLLAATEVAPLAKAGGLADVASALPKALAAVHTDIRVMMPCYEFLDRTAYNVRSVRTFPVSFAGKRVTVTLHKTTLPHSAVPVYLLAGSPYMDGEDIYYQTLSDPAAAERAQIERFLFFSQACVAALPHLGWWPDVVHCNDWHTAAIPYLLLQADQRSRGLASVYTIHNLALQGKVPFDQFARLTGMECSEDRARQGDRLNVTALGLMTSTMLSTVSPSYAHEVLTPAFGAGLDTILRERHDDLVGILNGIDTDVWNPATDSALCRTYTAANAEEGKADNQAALRKALGLRADGPVFGMVSRLTEQKGIDLLCAVAAHLVAAGGNVVILGSGDPALETRLRGLAAQHQRAVSLTTGFNAALANRIYAGSDFFLMPSRFEPCGLGQMIALRYGTVPIVHAVGGLRDTVQEGPTGMGFVFTEFTEDAFLAACRRGLVQYAERRAWRALVTRAMQQDFSWRASAPAYQALYAQAHERRT